MKSKNECCLPIIIRVMLNKKLVKSETINKSHHVIMSTLLIVLDYHPVGVMILSIVTPCHRNPTIGIPSIFCRESIFPSLSE